MLVDSGEPIVLFIQKISLSLIRLTPKSKSRTVRKEGRRLTSEPVLKKKAAKQLNRFNIMGFY